MTFEPRLPPPAATPFHRARRAVATAVAPLLVSAMLTGACASQPRSDAAKAESADPAAAAADPSTLFAPGGGTVILSPEGGWFVDEQGQEYYLVEVSREPYYKMLPDGRVMLPPGAPFEVIEERQDSLVVKIFNPGASVDVEPPPPAVDRSSLFADLAEIEVETTDRLHFTAFDLGLPDRGQWRQGFELVDLNGDGHLDIVHGPPRKGDGKPKIFLGDGEGGWSLWREARFEGQPLDYGAIAVADFNGDGELDLALAVHLRGLQVLVGDGRGHFRQWGEGLPYWVPGVGEEPVRFSSRTVVALDWDRDGRPDLLTLGEGPRLVRQPGSPVPGVSHGDRGPILFLNRGYGRWERYDQGTGRTKIYGDSLALGDFDGDGRTDFAVASRVRGAVDLVKLGREDGSWEDVSLGELVRPGVYGAVHAADLDGDGRDEILLGYAAYDGETWWTGVDRLDLEEGGWRRTPIVAEAGNQTEVTALTTGDVDGDGRLDVVALTGAGQRWILLGDAGGSFVREESAELDPAELHCQGYDVAVTRLGAGRPVVVMGFAGESGSEQIIPGQENKCPSEGSLEAWTPAPAARSGG